MFALFIHQDAREDLRALWNSNFEAAARLSSLFQELDENQDLLDRLTQHDYGAHPRADFHLSNWWEQWRRKRDLLRLKVWDLEDKGLRYRVVYAFIPRKRHYHILAIAPREFDYDKNHPISQRII